MKTLRYILRFVPVLVLALFVMSCTEKFDDPERYKEWTEEDLTADGYEIVSIWDFKKDYYYKPFGEYNENTGVWSINGAAVQSKLITDKVAIKGKVVSSDRYGNLYRSIYIQDIVENPNAPGQPLQDLSAALEIKIGQTGLYNDYKVGQMIYIKADGLVLGNYRFMLSLGGESSDPEYSNGFIDLQTDIERSILPGKFVGMAAQDTLVVNPTTVMDLRDPQDLGRLVRFEGAVSKWGTGTSSVGDDFSNTDRYPSFLQSIDGANETTYISWIYDSDNVWRAYATGGSVLPNAKWPGADEDSLYPGYPTWAFKDWGASYYGSALFVVGVRNLVVRTSGYSLFARVELPKNGEEATITAFYNKYASRSGGYIKYQLLLNSSNDVADPVTGKPLYKFDR